MRFDGNQAADWSGDVRETVLEREGFEYRFCGATNER